ncbi:MAG: hypothetical protein F6K42_37630 [Leptolyngbya sp. SIO1D8]|nr:hypothetical protein [Leptolyngbya sp. SIO1D8]
MSIQHINHHDIAGYKTCAAYTEASKEKMLATTLGETLTDFTALPGTQFH